MTKSTRDTLTSQWYRELVRSDWGATVTMRGSQADGRQDFFQTSEGGHVKGVGAGTGSLGFGCGKLRHEFGGAAVLDDPLKAQDKDSVKVRKATVDWFHNSIESRRNRKMKPMTPIVLDMQRLHSQDLAGYLLATERHRWTIVQIPAHDENNQSIWPARISMEELQHMKEYDNDTYLAQYMQQPSTTASELLLPGWWRFWTDRTEVERRVTLKIVTADTAFKEGDSNNYSVFQCWGVMGPYGMALLDQVRGKWAFPDLITHAKEFLKKCNSIPTNWTPVTECWVEDRASGTSLVQTLRKEGLPFKEWLPPHAEQRLVDGTQKLAGPDKVSRVKQSSMSVKVGRVFLPFPSIPDYRWVESFVNECSAFSTDNSHLYDDQVDTFTCANLIWQQRGGSVGQIPNMISNSWDDWLQRG